MTQLNLNISFEQLLQMLQQLTLDQKKEVVKKLKVEENIENILSGFKQSNFTDKEIFEEVEKVRKERYDRKISKSNS